MHTENRGKIAPKKTCQGIWKQLSKHKDLPPTVSPLCREIGKIVQQIPVRNLETIVKTQGPTAYSVLTVQGNRENCPTNPCPVETGNLEKKLSNHRDLPPTVSPLCREIGKIVQQIPVQWKQGIWKRNCQNTGTYRLQCPRCAGKQGKLPKTSLSVKTGNLEKNVKTRRRHKFFFFFVS